MSTSPYGPFPNGGTIDIQTSGFDSIPASKSGTAWWKVNGERYEVRVDSFAAYQTLDRLIKAKQEAARGAIIDRVAAQLEALRRNVVNQGLI